MDWFETDSVVAVEAHRWDLVVPLGRDATPPPFPTEVLPPWLRTFVQALADSTHTPVDMSAAFALGAIAASIGGYVKVRAGDVFVEQTNLYMVVAMPPSSVKSPVHRAVTAPLVQLEQELQDAAAPAVREALVRKSVAEKRLKRAEDDAAKASSAELSMRINQAQEARQELEELEVPTMPRLLVDDTTPEQLKTILAAQRGVLAMLSAESSLFGIVAGQRYSSDPNIEAVLSGHSGDRMVIDRRDRSETIEKPTLTICIAVQPSVLRRAAENVVARERGLFARFLYCMPPSNIGHRDFSKKRASVPLHAVSDYETRLVRMARLVRETPIELHLGTDAAAAFKAFEVRTEQRLGYGGDLAGVEKWAGKLRGHALRLAGVLHMALAEGGPISEETMGNAISLCEYFVEHAKIAHDEMDEDEGALRARLVLEWVRRGKRQRFTRDEVRAAMKGRVSADELDAVMTLLTKHHYVAKRQLAGGPGRPATIFHVNPQVTGITGVDS